MFNNKNWNYEKKNNFQKAQNLFNFDKNNQNNQFDNIFINPKASSFCNPSDYFINKQLLCCYDQNTMNINFPNNNTSLNNINKLFSPNLDSVVGDKKKVKKEVVVNENQFIIYLENVKY